MKPLFTLAHGEIQPADMPTESLASSSVAAINEPRTMSGVDAVADGSALREWTLADERNLSDRLASALLSGDPMERIDALADWAAQLGDDDAIKYCRIGGVPDEYLARSRRVDAKLRALPNEPDEQRDE